MTLPDLKSAQAITKFLRTSNDLPEVFELTKLLIDNESVLPHKQVFIVQLFESRLAAELNNSGNSKNNNKHPNKKKPLYYKEEAVWQILSNMIDGISQLDGLQRLLVVQSIRNIKFLSIFNLILDVNNSDLTSSYVNVLLKVSRRNLLNVSKSASQSSLSVLELFLQILRKSITSANNFSENNDIAEIVLRVYEYLTHNDLINLNFNSRELVAIKSHQFKEIVKFYKENSQFIINYYINSGLLDALLSILSQKNGPNDKNQELAKSIVVSFLNNSVTFEVSKPDQLNLSYLSSHFEQFIKVTKSEENILLLYQLFLGLDIWNSTISNTGNFEILAAVNENIIDALIGDENLHLSVNKVIQINLDQVKQNLIGRKKSMGQVFLSKAFVDKLYTRALQLQLSIEDFNKLSDSELAKVMAEIKIIDQSSAELLYQLMQLENSSSKKNFAGIDTFGFASLCVVLKSINSGVSKDIYAQLFSEVLHYNSLTSHLLIGFLDQYRKLWLVGKTGFLEDFGFSNQVNAKLSVLSVTQLNTVSGSTFQHFVNSDESKECQESYFFLFNSILTFLLSDQKNNHNSAKKKTFIKYFDVLSEAKFVKQFQASELYFKAVYQITLLFHFDELFANEAGDVTAAAGRKLTVFAETSIDYNNVYHVLTLFRFFENAPHVETKKVSVQKLLKNLSKQIDNLATDVQLKYLKAAFQRYFNVLFLVKDASELSSLLQKLLEVGSSDDAFYQSALTPILENVLFFENQGLANEFIKCVVAILSEKEKAIFCSKIILKIPIECFHRDQRAEVLDKMTELLKHSDLQSATTSEDGGDFHQISYYSRLVIEHLIVFPTYRSKLETEVDQMFDLYKGLVQVTKKTTGKQTISKETSKQISKLGEINDKIIHAVVDNFLKQHLDKQSDEFLSELIKKVSKALDKGKLNEKIFTLYSIISNVKQFYSFESKFAELKGNLAVFCQSYISGLVSEHANNKYPSIFELTLALKGLSVSAGVKSDSELKNIDINNNFFKTLDTYIQDAPYSEFEKLQLKIEVFAIIRIFAPSPPPSSSSSASSSEAKSVKFNVYYLTLFLILSSEQLAQQQTLDSSVPVPVSVPVPGDLITEDEEEEHSNNVLQLSLFKHLKSLGESEFVFLYSYVLKSIESIKETDGKNNSDHNMLLSLIKALSVLLKTLKVKKNEFEKINTKNLFASTLSVFLDLLDNDKGLDAAPLDEDLILLIITVLNFVISEVNHLMSQFTFEQLLLVILRISFTLKSNFSEPVYHALTRIISRILLLYRFRLVNRYQLLVKIFVPLLDVLASSGGNSNNSDAAAAAAAQQQSYERCADLYNRAIGNLCQPNDQSAKTVSKKKNELSSNVNIIKRDLRKHLPVVLLSFIKFALKRNFALSISQALVHNGIFLMFDVFTEKEFNFINSSLDTTGRMYFKTIFEDYQKFGKWKE